MNLKQRTVERLACWTRLVALVALLVTALAGCDTPDSLERKAKAYLDTGDRVAAAIRSQALLAMDPGNAEANLQFGTIMADVMRFAEAEPALRRALDLGKPAPEVMPVLGRVLLESGKNKELMELLEPDPARPQPSDPRTLAEYALLRGHALLGLRDATAAATQFQLAMTTLPDKAKLGQARLALARNDRGRAEEIIDGVIAANPGSVDARMAKADLLRSAGDIEGAARQYADIMKLDPANQAAFLFHAISLVSSGNTAAARPLLDKAKTLAPSGPLVYFTDALIECREKRYDSCANHLDRVFYMLPDYMPAVLLSAQRNYEIGNLESAQDNVMRYLAKVPDDTHARKLLAATLLAKSQPLPALDVLRPLIRSSSADPQVYGILGQAQLQLGDLRRAKNALLRAVALAPESAEFRSALALTNLASGLRRQAEADFRAAIALKPVNTKPDYGLIMLLLGENRLGEAREAVSALEQRLPNDVQTYMLKGVVLRQAGDPAGARFAFERAIQIERGFFPAVTELADMDVTEGKPDAARKRIQDELDRSPGRADAMLAMARIELRSGQREAGLGWAKRAVDANPGSNDALLLVAGMLADIGEINDAIGSAQQALKIRSRNAPALKLLGQLYMSKRDYPGAITTYTALVNAYPTSMDAALLLASAHVASGDTTTALAVARGALKRNPRSAAARRLVGDILLQAKKHTEAADFARELQRDYPKFAYGYSLEGDVLMAQGDPKRALKQFQVAAKLEPGGALLIRVYRAQAVASPGSEEEAPLVDWIRRFPDDNSARLFLADALAAKGRQKEAVPHYEDLLSRDPKNPQLLNNLSWALAGINDPRAFEYAERAFMLSPGAAPVIDTYGWALVSRGRVNEGVQLLLKAISLEPKNLEIRYHLAHALARAGDKVRAQSELKIVLDAGSAFPHADEARALSTALTR